MIIVTDLLITDHLISVSVILPYVPLVFRPSTPYHILQFTTTILCLKIAGLEANSVDPDETPQN